MWQAQDTKIAWMTRKKNKCLSKHVHRSADCNTEIASYKQPRKNRKKENDSNSKTPNKKKQYPRMILLKEQEIPFVLSIWRFFFFFAISFDACSRTHTQTEKVIWNGWKMWKRSFRLLLCRRHRCRHRRHCCCCHPVDSVFLCDVLASCKLHRTEHTSKLDLPNDSSFFSYSLLVRSFVFFFHSFVWR